MVFKIFKRSKVPDELPELASDKIGGFFNEEGKIVHKYLEEEEVKNNFRDPEYLLIKDECALIMGNLIHKIQNEGECKIACQNSCKIKGYFYFNSTFVSFNNQCNTCDCYCK